MEEELKRIESWIQEEKKERAKNNQLTDEEKAEEDAAEKAVRKAQGRSWTFIAVFLAVFSIRIAFLFLNKGKEEGEGLGIEGSTKAFMDRGLSGRFASLEEEEGSL